MPMYSPASAAPPWPTSSSQQSAWRNAANSLAKHSPDQRCSGSADSWLSVPLEPPHPAPLVLPNQHGAAQQSVSLAEQPTHQQGCHQTYAEDARAASVQQASSGVSTRATQPPQPSDTMRSGADLPMNGASDTFTQNGCSIRRVQAPNSGLPPGHPGTAIPVAPERRSTNSRPIAQPGSHGIWSVRPSPAPNPPLPLDDYEEPGFAYQNPAIRYAIIQKAITISLDAQPDAVTWKRWNISTRDKCANAFPLDEDACIIWYNEINKATCLEDPRLLNCPEEFRRLESALLTAVIHISHGPIAAVISRMLESYVDAGKRPRGRQLVFMHKQNCAADASHVRLIESIAILNLKLQNDNLERFLSDIDEYLLQFVTPDNQQFESMVNAQLKQSSRFKQFYAHYEMNICMGMTTRDWATLVHLLRTFCSNNRIEKNNTALMNQAGLNMTAAGAMNEPTEQPSENTAAPAQGSFKGICQYFQNGRCFKGDACTWQHIQKPSQPVQQQRGRSMKSNRPSQSPRAQFRKGSQRRTFSRPNSTDSRTPRGKRSWTPNSGTSRSPGGKGSILDCLVQERE